MSKEKKIFALGDSRTGTTTIHKFLKLSGFTSIHYFFKESGVSEPAHVDFENNWRKLQDFIDEGGYDSFSDYPIRTFYRKLFDAYPDAYFILTSRKDVETWQKSMVGFFSKFKINLNIEKLTESYLSTNEDIRRIAAERGANLCDICIDDDPDSNGALLSQFLSLDEPMSLGWENSTLAYDNSLWSSRVTLYNSTSNDVITYVRRITNPAKAMLSEYGWVFLINDTSDFFEYLYGKIAWSGDQESRAYSTLALRHTSLKEIGVTYLKFIIPEKASVYPQYLPKIFTGHAFSDTRPAISLEKKCGEFLSYPLGVLRDVQSYGNLYFRGDSHANWLGAFFIYQHIVERLNNALERASLPFKTAFGLSSFEVSLASYAGDIFSQLDKEMRAVFDAAWRPLKLSDERTEKIEYTVRYTLSPSQRKATRMPVGEELLALLGVRESFRYTHPNKKLPRAVVFRDSTAEYLVEALAEHFSESLFIWHKGHVYEDVIERERPDVVLHIMAERFVSAYPSFHSMTKLGLTRPGL